MKNIGKITKLILSGCLMLVFSAILSSCTYDESDTVGAAGDSFIRIVAAKDGDSGFITSIAAFDAVPSTNTFLEVRRDAVSSADLNTTVTATFSIDNTIVDNYNTEYVDAYNADVDEYNSDLDSNDDGIDDLEAKEYIDYYEIIDPSLYTFESQTVTFQPGEFAVFVPMTLDPSTLSFTTQYALGARLESPSGSYKVSEVGKASFVKVAIKNAYDGVYKYGPGTIERFTGGAPNEDDPLQGDFESLADRDLITTGANTVSFTPLWATGGGVGGIDGTYIDVSPVIQPDGKQAVTVKSTNPSMVNIVGEENSYDPATGVFKLAFTWGTANKRTHRCTLTYKGPR